jgi:hypothetical protein
MKKAKKSKARTNSKARSRIKARARITGRAKAHARVSRRRKSTTKSNVRRDTGVGVRRQRSNGVSKVAKGPNRSAANLAARVLANRSASKAARRPQPVSAEKAPGKYAPTAPAQTKGRQHRPHPARPARPPATAYNLSRQLLRMSRAPQFTYMKAPGADSAFDVGDTVEVFCDHERDSERVRGWVKGVVVQVDNKLVAVQFRSNVFLTDGWMVPDRILWYALTSDQIRTAGLGKKGSRRTIPDY